MPNITFGSVLIQALRRVTSLPFDIHLMIAEPERHLEAFAEGAETVNVHIETSPHINRTLTAIRALGCRAGVCLNPGTPVAAIEESLAEVDQVMVMTINPGWGGQKMIPAQLEKVSRVRAALDRAGSGASVEIDGGVKASNVAACVQAGADALVCGSSVFNSSATVAENLNVLRKAIPESSGS